MTDDNVRQIWSDAELDAALTELHRDVGDDDGLAFARSSLLAAAGAEPEEAPKPRRSGSWRWIAVAAAVVTLAGGVVVTADLLSPSAPAPVHPAATPPDLDRTLAPGEYRYSRREYWLPFYGSHDDLAYVQQQVELWVPADPAGRWHRRATVTGRVVGYVADIDRTKIAPPDGPTDDEYGPGGAFPSFQAGPHPMPWPEPEAKFLQALTPDEVALRKLLVGTGRIPGEQLMQVASALTPGLPAKDVRAALCTALSKLDGITALPDKVRAPDGRQALAFLATGSHDTLYVDPTTFLTVATTSYPPSLLQFPEGGPTPTSVVGGTTQTLPPRAPASTTTTTPLNAPVATSRPLSPSPGRQRPMEPPTLYFFSITRSSS
ncbi:hypothetical protein ACGFMK_02605 [Amycolatopsis sp. NPDC049252]|uniref:hypothetical protein n=1 Tax=Amycolatopsis sp. NPDC049252 TaxID=3363933 RepID=UPI00371951C5